MSYKELLFTLAFTVLLCVGLVYYITSYYDSKYITSSEVLCTSKGLPFRITVKTTIETKEVEYITQFVRESNNPSDAQFCHNMMVLPK